MKLKLILSIALLAACAGAAHATVPAPSAVATATGEAAEAPAARFDRLLAEHWEAMLELNPVMATFIGDHRFNDRYPVSIAPEHRAATRALLERSLAAVEAVPPESLDEQHRLSQALFLRETRHRLEAERFPSHLLPVNQFRGAPSSFAMLGSGTSAQPFATVADYENFLKRMDGFTAWVDQAILNMREGVKTGVVQPAILMERTLPQLAAHVVEAPEISLFYRPVSSFPDAIPESEQPRLRAAYVAAITDKLVPAYARLHDFIRDEYLPACRETYGMRGLPDGEAWYAHLIRQHTTTELGAQEILAAHEALREKADLAAPRLFHRSPRASYEIRAVEEFRERSAAKGSYQRPSADGSRPGIYYINTWNPQARPRWDAEALFLHEAALGERLDIRDFHAEVLGQGDLPLDVLEERIDAWIARVAATAATARLQ